MSLKSELAPQLPYLRRYARALTGSQTHGDAAVREFLSALLAAPEQYETSENARIGLYRAFHRLWNGQASVGAEGGTISGLSLHHRQSLLLTTIEEFSVEDAASIVGSSTEEISAGIKEARQAIAGDVGARVLIIEDEAIIALHIRTIVEEMGHEVIGVAQTRSEAVNLGTEARPDLVLADISLADGSSGIDAVKDLLAVMDVPVIFITAFPERLLTGARPEPTYLVTKPFISETVAATIGQALLHHRERASLARTEDPAQAQSTS